MSSSMVGIRNIIQVNILCAIGAKGDNYADNNRRTIHVRSRWGNSHSLR